MRHGFYSHQVGSAWNQQWGAGGAGIPTPGLSRSPWGPQAHLGRARLGQPPVVLHQQQGEYVGALGYTLASLAGAALGGGIIGYIASGGAKPAAFTGAFFASGMTSFSNTWLFIRENNPGGAMMTLVFGLGLLGKSLYDFSGRNQAVRAQFGRN